MTEVLRITQTHAYHAIARHNITLVVYTYATVKRVAEDRHKLIGIPIGCPYTEAPHVGFRFYIKGMTFIERQHVSSHLAVIHSHSLKVQSRHKAAFRA